MIRIFAEAKANNWGDYFPDTPVENDDYIVIKAFYSEHLSQDELQALTERLTKLKSFGLETGVIKIETSSVDEEKWATAWKEHYHTEHIGNIVIQPSWESYDPLDNEVVVKLDPGMAFGTGGHPTTCMVLEQLQNIDLKGKVVWDIGTGSGILAIAAAKLGASTVIGVDTDKVAVEVADENCRFNEVDVTIKHGSLDSLSGKADIIIANIIADVILSLLPDVVTKLKENGLFIASGIIDERAKEVLEKAGEYGFNLQFEDREAEWVAFCFSLKEV